MFNNLITNLHHISFHIIRNTSNNSNNYISYTHLVVVILTHPQMQLV